MKRQAWRRPPWQNKIDSHVFRSGCLFGGAGGMALGTQWASQEYQGQSAHFTLCGAYDNSLYACRAYEYLTGCKEEQLDAKTVTEGDVYRLFGGVVPDAVWISAPCKGSSKLLSSAKAKTKKYAVMNTLSYRGVKTLLDAFPGDEPPFIIFENVPNITTRARLMLKALRALLKSHGYVLHDGFHEARHIGDLAQRRKRWFMVARLPWKVPVFLYKPPHKAGKVCGDVLGALPLPNDPAGGPMHRLSDTWMLNLLRLWAIPAGGDWRDLIADGRPRRHRVESWEQPSVTIGGSGSNGPCGIADPRKTDGAPGGRWVTLARTCPGFTSMDHVLAWDAASRTITAATKPGSGAPSIADPRPLNLLGQQTAWFGGKYGVTAWDSPTRTVIGGEANGASFVADPRVQFQLPLMPASTVGAGKWDVFRKHEVAFWGDATGTVIAGADHGASAVADPRLVLLNPTVAWHDNALGVVGAGDVGPTVTGAAGRPSTGRFSYADPFGGSRWNKYGVIGQHEPAATVTGEAAPSTGAFSPVTVPLDLRPQPGNEDMHWSKYVVIPFDGTVQTVTTASRVGSGAGCVADPRIDLATTDSAFHEGSGPGRLGVLTPLDTSSTVTGNARLHTGPFSYAAPPPKPVDLVPVEACYDAGYGVLSPGQPARTIAAKAWPGTGAYAIQDEVPTPVDLIPAAGVDTNHAGRYGVLEPGEPSRTITGTSEVGCGAYAIAAGVPQVHLGLGCEPRADAYGVTPFDREVATVTGHFKVDNSRAAVADPRPAPPPYVILSYEETKRIVNGDVQVPFAIVDPAHPGEPLAIVDDLKRPPFRWVERVVEKTSKRGKVSRKVTRARETVALVLISKDRTWHRPLTTYELAILQSFPAQLGGKPLDFDGGTTAQREVIGNAVPPKVGQAMSNQLLLSLTVAKGALASMGDPGTAVWVRNVRALKEQLRAEGFVVADGIRPMNFTTGEQLDDGAFTWTAARPKRKRARGRAPDSKSLVHAGDAHAEHLQ